MAAKCPDQQQGKARLRLVAIHQRIHGLHPGDHQLSIDAGNFRADRRRQDVAGSPAVLTAQCRETPMPPKPSAK